MADILYSLKAFGVLPTEIADQIQDVLEEEMTQAVRSLIDDVFKMECFKVPVEKTEVERDAISDITHYDSCLDSIGEKLENFMAVPQHVLLPGDECLRNVDSEARAKRIQVRNQIKMKIASNRELEKEIAKLKHEKQVMKRLAEAKEKVDM